MMTSQQNNRHAEQVQKGQSDRQKGLVPDSNVKPSDKAGYDKGYNG